MAVIQLGLSKGETLDAGPGGGISEATGGAPLAILADTAAGAGVTAATATDTAAVAAAIAVLVADGASPTQAHVNTANAAWGTLLALINTLKTSATTTKTATATALAPADTFELSIASGASKEDALKALEIFEAKIVQSVNFTV